jgi:PAS domain S-box-containing protein
MSNEQSAKQQLEQRNAEIEVIKQISEILVSDRPMREIYQDIVEVIAEATPFEKCSIEEFDAQQEQLVFVGFSGTNDISAESPLRVDLDETISGTALQSREVLVIEDAREDERYQNEQLKQEQTRSFLAVPMIHKGEPKGVLSLASEQVIEIDEQLPIWLQSIANYLVGLIDRRLVYDRLEESEAKLRTFYDYSSEGIWMCRMDEPVSVDLPIDEQVEMFFEYGYFSDCNDTMVEMYGLDSPDDIIGQPLSAVLTPEESQNVAYLKAFVEQDYALIDAETVEYDSEGNRHYFLNNLRGVIRDGMIQQAWGTQRDITEVKQAQERLEQSRKLLQLHNKVLVEMTAAEELHSGNQAESFAYITEQVAEAMNVDRVAIWLFPEHKDDRLVCEDVYLKHENRHSQGQLLLVEDYKGMRKEILERRIIAVADTSDIELSASDTASGLKAVMSAPLRRGGSLMGMIGVYNYDEPHKWSPEEQGFIASVADLTALSVEANHMRKVEEALRSMSLRVASSLGADFFNELVRHMVDFFDVEYAMIGRIVKVDGVDKVETLALCHEGELVENIIYDLSETPCEFTVRENQCSIPRNVQQQYPSDSLLQELNIECYVGAVLTDAHGEEIGVLNIMGERPMTRTEPIDSLLALYAERASAELRRLKSEQLLKDSEERFRILFDSNPTMYFILRTDGTIEAINEFGVESLGYSREELVNHSVEEIFVEEDQSKVQPALQKVLDQPDRVHQWELRKCKQDGSVIWVQEFVRVIRDSKGEQRFLVVCEDISHRVETTHELIKAKERAEAANRFKSVFLANMSHEIRTPLNGILGFASVLEGEVQDRELQELANRIQRSGNRLLETINSVLDLAKIEANKLEVDLRPTPVNEVIEEAVRLLEPIAENKQLELRLNLKHPLPTLLLDKRLLNQILNNLIGNALKFTDQGFVEVRTKRAPQEDAIVIEVADSGIGISDGFLTDIFEEFKQESSGYQRKYEGSGLGLTITKNLVEKMGGQISVESTLGKGSTFRVSFPVQWDHNSVDTSDSVSREPSSASPAGSDLDKAQQPLILLIEDNEDSRDVTRFYLRKHAEMVTASNREEALQQLQENEFDVILMDINLGDGENGMDLLQTMKTEHLQPNTPVVAITAYAMKDDRDRLLGQGFDQYLAKPYSRRDLLDLLGELLPGSNEA